MKNTKIPKRIFSLLMVIFAVVALIPVQSFASGGTYCVFEDFENVSSPNAISGITFATDKNAAGTITLDTANKCIKFDKKQNITNKAFYTDVYFDSDKSRDHCKYGSRFVFEITFWYTGSLDGLSWNELVGGRKENDGKPVMKVFLGISQGKLVTGDKQTVTSLEPNKKYKVAIAVNDAQSNYDIYLNDSKTATLRNVPYENSEQLSFTNIRGLNLTAMSGNAANFPDVYADDIKLYYAEKPVHVGGTPSSSNPLDNANTGGGNNGGGTSDGGAENGGIENAGTENGGTTDVSGSQNNDPLANIKLPYVKPKKFEFTATPQKSERTECDPIVLEKKTDALFISGIGGASVLVIALTVVFSKKFS